MAQQNCCHMTIERVSEEEKALHNGALKPWFKCGECGALFMLQTNIQYIPYAPPADS